MATEKIFGFLINSSGNFRGTIDEHFRPTGDTPDIGAIPRGGEMFEYGATWELGNQPSSDGTVPDYVDLNLGSAAPSEAPSELSQLLQLWW